MPVLRRSYANRRLRRTCPRCRAVALTRIERTESLGFLRTLTRYCTACDYSDGFVREPDPDRLIERNARDAAMGEPYFLPNAR